MKFWSKLVMVMVIIAFAGLLTACEPDRIVLCDQPVKTVQGQTSGEFSLEIHPDILQVHPQTICYYGVRAKNVSWEEAMSIVRHEESRIDLYQQIKRLDKTRLIWTITKNGELHAGSWIWINSDNAKQTVASSQTGL
jgi:hypothetical protein